MLVEDHGRFPRQGVTSLGRRLAAGRLRAVLGYPFAPPPLVGWHKTLRYACGVVRLVCRSVGFRLRHRLRQCDY